MNFSYGDQQIFEAANINVDDHWKLGLVGRNGRGKTTLLNILEGKLQASGKINHRKSFVYFPQEVMDLSQLTLWALQELADFELWKLERELTLLSVPLEALYRPFESLSGGEQTKCLLALLFLDEERNFPLIDEPTNHLDLVSREQLAVYLRQKSGFILVSHDRYFLNQVTDHTLAIERAQLILYQGNFEVYEQEKQRRDAFEEEEDLRLRRDISRLKQTAREKEAWSRKLEATKSRTKRGFDTETKRVDKGFIGAKAAAMMQKSKNLEKRMKHEISDKEKLLKNIEHTEALNMRFEPDHHKLLLRLENFNLSYDDKLFAPLNVELERGEILVISGKNGRGKSSLIKALMGKFEGEIQGEFEIPKGIQISIIRQQYKNQGTLKDFAEAEGLDYELFLANLKKLGMEREVFKLAIENMSQGQQKKVELAKSLSLPAQLYIWDEPLNYLDVFNHEQIMELLKNVRPTMLIIEHDQHFIEALADKLVELKKV